MGLESKIPGWSHADRYLYKKFSKIRDESESIGLNKYFLSLGIGICGGLTFMAYANSKPNLTSIYISFLDKETCITDLVVAAPVATALFAAPALYGADLLHSCYKTLIRPHQVAEGIEENSNFVEKFFKTVRAPAMGAFLLLSGFAMYEFTNNGNAYMDFLTYGLLQLGISSSMYIKGDEPEPTGKGGLGEKIGLVLNKLKGFNPQHGGVYL